MNVPKLEGSEIPTTLEQIEAERQRARSAARKEYFAGKCSLIAAIHMIEDIDRAAEKASDRRVNSLLAPKVAA